MKENSKATVETTGSAPKAAASPKETREDPRLVVGPSPHLHTPDTVPVIMRWVVIALLPACWVSYWFFGIEALRVLFLATAACMAVEWACFRMLKTPGSLRDWSAAVSGILLGMNLPPTAPWWLVVAGAIVAMLITKHLFGGLGANIFNPVLTARAFLLVSWPVHMTTWVRPGVHGFITDAELATVTEATPLGLLKEGRLSEIASTSHDLMMGNVGGSVGEISAIALLLGGLLLLWRRVITWEIPVTFVASVAVITGLAYMIGGPERYAPVHFHLLSGGLILGAFFMATDLVTSPLTFRGRVVFGIGCGLLTSVIRLWGGYPEGVSFAILLMNGFTPLLDHYIRPKTFGSRTMRVEVAR
jgi:Na+-translocating ferredoxin:NAD+ oxidoreductase subunit D